MKRLLLGLGAMAAVLAAIAAAYFIPFKGDWVDRWFSGSLSAQTNLPLQAYGVDIRRWSDAQFRLLHLARGSKTLFASGQGKVIRRPTFGEFSQIRIWMKDVAVMEDVYAQTKLLSWAARRAFDEPLFIERLQVDISRAAGNVRAHIREFKSDEIRLAGGAEWKDSRLFKMHLVVLLPHHRFEQIPKELRARMIPAGNGWRGVRVLFYENRLRVVGSLGTFFEMQAGSWTN